MAVLVAAHLFAAALQGGGRADDGAEQRAAGRADDRALGVAANGLADESTAGAADKCTGSAGLGTCS